MCGTVQITPQNLNSRGIRIGCNGGWNCT